MRSVLLLLIKGYKMAISPYMPGQCRYDPTCSEFAADAIKTHGDYNALLKLALAEVGKYIHIIEKVNNFDADTFEEAMTEDVAHLLKSSNDKLGLTSYVYEREHGSPHNDKLLLAFPTGISAMTTIKKFVEGYCDKTGTERKSFHHPLYALIKSNHGEWFSTDNESDAKKFIRFYAYMEGNNQIYIDLLNMVKGWLQFIEVVKCDHPDTDLLAEVKRYNDMKLDKVTFKPLNQFMTDVVYKSAEYKTVFGEAQLYFYIDNTRFNVDVSHELFDEDKTRMNELVAKYPSDTFNIKTTDPLNKTWGVIHKKMKGSFMSSGY